MSSSPTAPSFPSEKRPRFALIINAGAGTAERYEPDALKSDLEAMFGRRAVSDNIEFAPSADLRRAAEHACERAKAKEIDAVVVGGGDGSARAVASVLAGTEVPLGLLPLGTLNHFARDLGIPTELEGAVETACDFNVRPVDVGEVNAHVFINNSSIGIYPYMVLDRERRRRSAAGQSKWKAMFFAVVRTFQQFPVRRLSICIEGRTEPYRTPCLFVGNNQYGLGLASFGVRESLDRGELWLYVAKAQSRTAMLWLACRSALSGTVGESDLKALEASSAEITSRTSRLLVALDGEVEVIRPPLLYRSRPGALQVLAPSTLARSIAG